MDAACPARASPILHARGPNPISVKKKDRMIA